MQVIQRLKSHYFPRGIRRDLSRHTNRIFHRTNEKVLRSLFKNLRIADGSVVCIHAMLSGLGYIVGGPKIIFEALIKTVPDVTIMMPTFPFTGTMDDYLKNNRIYNREKTPSRSGLLSETMRQLDGVHRSLHPTHPCAAWGPKSADLIDGTEKAVTPFGDESTYGRFTERDDAILLLLHTNNTSMVHRIQEMVHMPNLFLEGLRLAKAYNADNVLTEYQVRAHMPTIPLYLALPGDTHDTIEYMWFPDYVLLFPEYNKIRIFNNLKSESLKNFLIARHKEFEDQGIYTAVRYKSTEILAVRVKPWLSRICKDITENLNEFEDHYQNEIMNQAMRKGMLTKERG